MRQLSDVDGLTASDVMHGQLSTLPATTTVRELRAYFAASTSHRLALIVDGPRYVGSIGAGELPADAEAGLAVAGLARRGDTIAPDAPAARARDAALADSSRRVPVVDERDTLLGIVAINRDRTGFCGT